MKRNVKLHGRIRKQMERAIIDYRMISKGDRVLVGVSGGPDSLSLLHFMRDGFIHAENDFSLIAAHVDLGFEQPSPVNSGILESHFQTLGVEYVIRKTDISRKALDPNARKNPCFICSHERRRKMYESAHELGCNKIAYGHHKDDIIETLLINIFYGRKVEAMSPVQPVFKGSMFIIRPFCYVDEHDVKSFAEESALPALKRLCPMDGNTRRQKIKELIRRLQLDEKNANIRENIFKSLYYPNLVFSPESLNPPARGDKENSP